MSRVESALCSLYISHCDGVSETTIYLYCSPNDTYIWLHNIRYTPRWSIASSDYPRMLLIVLILEFESRRGQILKLLLSKILVDR